jgi:beta-lactam-binding protein with PASTA domain
MEKLFSFLKSKTFLANAVLALLFFAAVIGLTQLLLRACTHHGEAIEVPSLSGLSLSEAEALLNDADLDFRVIDSAEFNPEVPLGAVIDQYPAQGALVKSGRQILLTINPFTVHKIELPNIIDKTLRRAIYDLESKGFVVGVKIYKPDLARDAILGMQINSVDAKPGDKFVRGTVVDLIVGTGIGDERIAVPYLRWLTAQQAVMKLRSLSLNSGLIVYDDEVTDTLTALVYKQTPGPTLEPMLPLGTTIDIWLTNDSTKIPNDSLAFKQILNPDSTQVNAEGDREF